MSVTVSSVTALLVFYQKDRYNGQEMEGCRPVCYPENQIVPEQINELEGKDRCENLVFHPPNHPYTIGWMEKSC